MVVKETAGRGRGGAAGASDGPDPNPGASQACWVWGETVPPGPQQPRRSALPSAGLGWRKPFMARCTRHSESFHADRAFVVLTPSRCPVFCSSLVSSPGPDLGSGSTKGRQHRVFFFSLLPGHPGNVGAWPPALWEETQGPAPCILSKSCFLPLLLLSLT